MESLALSHRKVGFGANSLVDNASELRAQQAVYASVDKAPTHLCELSAQCQRGLVCLRQVAVTVAGEPHKVECSALGEVMFDHHSSNGLTFDLWG